MTSDMTEEKIPRGQIESFSWVHTQLPIFSLSLSQ